MQILGIHDGHNASACLLRDGRILMAVQEERLRRIKNYAGFPSMAIRMILQECGIDLRDIDCFALAGKEMPDQNTREDRLALYRKVGSREYAAQRDAALRRSAVYNSLLPSNLRRAFGLEPCSGNGSGRLAQAVEFGIPKEKIHVVEHHLAHASAAYYGLGDYGRDVLVLTNDGEGDGICASVSVGRNGTLQRIGSVPRSESIGNLYAVVTFLMGMVPLEHEYKLMGMAPYADERRAAEVCGKLKALFAFDERIPFGWKRADGCPDLFFSYSFIRDRVELDRFDSLCGGLQRFTEETLLDWVRNCIARTGIRRLALSGGVFMNVKLNKAIMELPEVESLFIFPSCGDETNSIGAAYQVCAGRADHRQIAPLTDLYFGKDWDNNDVRAAIEAFSFSAPVECRREEDIDAAAAALLAEGAVVARFRGREEFGARALGNRSILADPSNTEVIKVINSMIKCRDFWMPFAASMTDRQAAACLKNPKQIAAPYMILTFDTTELIRDFRAGAHPYDLTVRPQVVQREWNPGYYRLIEEFATRSGKRGGVLNTSFNLHGHPLVSSPADALDVFNRSGLQVLAIEDYLLQKRSRQSGVRSQNDPGSPGFRFLTPDS